jgi:predicted ATP-grasp superfamily ATP-dependent carboligase
VTVGHDGPRDGSWLVKPLRSGGGARVRRWRGPQVPRGHYAQSFIEGAAGSVVFVAAGGQAVVLGTTRQLVGDAAFGARGFRYCGSLLCGPSDPSMRAQADAIATVAASAFGLVGVGGVDFIDDGRVMHPVEVNPRWTASMELVERARGLSMFGAHARACTSGVLPASEAGAGGLVHGKAIVFARRGLIAGDTCEWLTDPTVRDIPRPGMRITARQPVCTVLAHGVDAADCYRALVNRAEAVYAQLALWARAAA